MNTVTFKGTTFFVDSSGYLLHPDEWSEDFAEGMAPSVKITDGLTEKHWDVIYCIRNTIVESGKCPLVYETCRKCEIHLAELNKLFPTGYQRGACKLAGFSYEEGYVQRHTYWPELIEDGDKISRNNTYLVDAYGFLFDPSDWNEHFAVYKAEELKMQGGLTDKHWQIIRFLREHFENNGVIPTVYQTCGTFHFELDELEKLFPDGYHRGAVKIAGLRIR